MAKLKVDMPSLIMVLAFTGNIIISHFCHTRILLPRGFAEALLVSGFLFFAYVLFYLASWLVSPFLGQGRVIFLATMWQLQSVFCNRRTLLLQTLNLAFS